VAFDHVKKLDDMPYKALFAVATGLVFLCQLLAMVLVVNGQVEKAQLRTAQYNATETAIADCSNAHSGPARSHCIDQVNWSLNPHPGYIPAIETRDLNQLAMQGNANTAGLMKTTFTSAQ